MAWNFGLGIAGKFLPDVPDNSVPLILTNPPYGDEAEPLHLSRHAAALRLLQYVRDEAHRFAQHYHHILRRKKLQGDE